MAHFHEIRMFLDAPREQNLYSHVRPESHRPKLFTRVPHTPRERLSSLYSGGRSAVNSRDEEYVFRATHRPWENLVVPSGDTRKYALHPPELTAGHSARDNTDKT